MFLSDLGTIVLMNTGNGLRFWDPCAFHVCPSGIHWESTEEALILMAKSCPFRQ